MCKPCGYVPNHPSGCQDYSAPHAAEAGDSPEYPVQPAMPRMGRRSTVCCGVEWGTAYEVICHTEAVHN